MTVWIVEYKEEDVKCSNIYIIKKEAIKKYLELLDSGSNISELKMIKNKKDYTRTLNKFLK